VRGTRARLAPADLANDRGSHALTATPGDGDPVEHNKQIPEIVAADRGCRLGGRLTGVRWVSAR
jgi:hypothetical protein